MIYAIAITLDLVSYSLLSHMGIVTHTNLLCAVISNILTFLIILVACKTLNKNTLGVVNGFFEFLVIFTIPFCSILIAITSFYFEYNFVSVLVIVSCLLLMNALVFCFYDILTKYYTEKQESALLKLNNDAYAHQFEIINKSDKALRMLKHDLTNHVISLQSLLENEDFSEAQSYLTKLQYFTKTERQYVSSQNQFLNSILNYKLTSAEQLGACLDISVVAPDKLNIDLLDLSVILGNLLDNSIEALSHGSEKRLTITIYFEKSLLYISISNSYDLPIRRSGSRFLTLKDNPTFHGIGLENVRHTVEKYHGELDISYDEAMFHVNLMLNNSMI